MFQNTTFCNPHDSDCYEEVAKDNQDCKVSCTGLYADTYIGEEYSEDTFKKTEGNSKGKSIIHNFRIFCQICKKSLPYSTNMRNTRTTM